VNLGILLLAKAKDSEKIIREGTGKSTRRGDRGKCISPLNIMYAGSAVRTSRRLTVKEFEESVADQNGVV